MIGELVRHHVPTDDDIFVGRTKTLQAMLEWIVSEARLLTVLGGPGMGKTRTSVRFAWSPELGAHLDEIVFVDASSAESAEALLASLARALGVELKAAAHLSEGLSHVGRGLAERGRVLLLLDNLEQVIEPASKLVAELLAQSPDTRILVTSRERLRLRGEHVLEISPLEVASEGLELFLALAEAQGVRTSFTETDLEHIMHIVEVVDGLPLAIRLAAARLNVLDPEHLLERLSKRFSVLRHGTRLNTRHNTLWNAIDSSWTGLEPWEQKALCRCAVFSGSFDIEAAEALIGLDAHPTAPAPLDVVQALRDKSLLTSRRTSRGLRFSLLLSVRDFALAHLEADAKARLGLRFAHTFGARAERLLERLKGTEKEALRAFRELELDQPHHEAVVAWAEQAPKAQRPQAASYALQNARVLEDYFMRGGPVSRHVHLMERALAISDDAPRAWLIEGELSLVRARFALRDREASERHLSRARAAMDAEGMTAGSHVGDALLLRAKIIGYLGSARDEALDLLEEAKAAFEAAQEPVGLARCEAMRGALLYLRGQPHKAVSSYAEALALYRQHGGGLELPGVTITLSLVQLSLGRVEEGLASATAALEAARASQRVRSEAHALKALAFALQARGELKEAEAAARASLRLSLRIGETIEALWRSVMLSGMALDTLDFEEARHQHTTTLELLSRLENVPFADFAVLGVEIRQAWLEGRFEAARDTLVRVLADAPSWPTCHLMRAQLGAVLSQLGEHERAASSLDEAEAALDEHDRSRTLAAALYRAYALSLRDEEGDAGLVQRLRDVLLPQGSEAPWVQRSDDVRRAHQLLMRALPEPRKTAVLEAVFDERAGRYLLIEAEGRWFSHPDETRVELGRKKQLCLMLRLLAERHQDPHLPPLTLPTLVPLLWPDERISDVESMRKRVHFCIARLRKAGLGDLLAFDSKRGYHLSETLPIRIVSSS